MKNICWEGTIVEILITPALDQPMQSMTEAQLVVGRGIEGDRHYLHPEETTEEDEPSYEATLIEQKAIASVQEEARTHVEASSLWRTIVTAGCEVSHLVGREFQIGDVRLRDLSLYEPSPRLMEVVGHKVAVSLIHRGKLAAEILVGGVIHVGDTLPTSRTLSCHEQIFWTPHRM